MAVVTCLVALKCWSPEGKQHTRVWRKQGNMPFWTRLCICACMSETWQVDPLRWSYGTAADAAVFIKHLTFIPKQRRGGIEGKRQRGRAIARKTGGSRGNPPCVGLCVSCHWWSAHHVPAKNCIVWSHGRHLSHSLSLLSLHLSRSLFSLSQSSCLPQAMHRLACLDGIPIPPVFKTRAEWKSEQGREGKRQIWEQKSYRCISFFSLPHLPI